tara:strand:+ start:922 stop:1092 length:171 start_codon:yes stop_codon:yes gene_type:complete
MTNLNLTRKPKTHEQIIRQSCLNRAVDLAVNDKIKLGEIELMAEKFEEWVWRVGRV